MLPFEFTATPATSPKLISGGIVSGSGTDSNGSSGTAACAAGAGVCVATGAMAQATNATASKVRRFMGGIIEAVGLLHLKLRMSVKAVLFDVDGTLIDSNDAHAAAWVRAFTEFDV